MFRAFFANEVSLNYTTCTIFNCKLREQATTLSFTNLIMASLLYDVSVTYTTQFLKQTSNKIVEE